MHETRLLMLLENAGPEGMKVLDLSKDMQVTSPFVTQQLNRMEDNGLIVRTKGEEDRRIVKISLTDKGRAAADREKEHFKRMLAGLCEHLGEADSRELARLMNLAFDYFEEKMTDREEEEGN
ncbi:MarR family winged helix-turn-helix transcriptional regulator [Paenibacillus sp. GCM10012307]|uniref:MarR family transcriptional regulator n=2 Tax=Paenibacillus TaxID=44249 RepID=A0A934J077_9BACL|nr:MarR family transcriptional regulator [Paenibacillus roseus]MBJ6360315.1 MarR family transcriptional regulator [Paenibacillus roseus]